MQSQIYGRDRWTQVLGGIAGTLTLALALAAALTAALAVSPGGNALAAGRVAPSTLSHAPLMPDQPLDRLTRSVAQSEFGRDLFGDPTASALVGQVEIFDRFPYVRARYVQLVTDRAWNRVLFGEQGRVIHAYDGVGTDLGPLSGPAGIDRDPRGRIFIADALNDRIVVLELRGDGDELRLEPRFAIDGLARPTGVAWDGGTTPLDPADDHLWVADTGNHRVVCYELSTSGATQVASFGGRGNAEGQFLEPRDVEVGHADGLHSADVYVADWGNGRLVRLARHGNRIEWLGSRRLGTDLRSVASDAWGNVYVALRDAGQIAKLDRELDLLVKSGNDFPGLRDLSVGFLTVTDHRHGTRRFTGYSSLFAIESWSISSGARRLELGLEARDLAVERAGDGAELAYLLTDHADVEVSVIESGRVVRGAELGRVAAGRQAWSWDGRDDGGEPVTGPVAFEIRAQSLYEGGGVAFASTGGDGSGSGIGLVAAIDAAWPNPANPATQIRFTVPAATDDLRLEIFDLNGRLQRRLVDGDVTRGSHVVSWDGTDARGLRVASGTYFVSLRIDGTRSAARKLTLVK
jgi:flagellar hook assembly protein FlgD